jgi:TolB-like protein
VLKPAEFFALLLVILVSLAVSAISAPSFKDEAVAEYEKIGDITVYCCYPPPRDKYVPDVFVGDNKTNDVQLCSTRISIVSIAVLPFENLSDTGGDAYFADGIQDEILSNLAKLSRLNVISRTSVRSSEVPNKRNIRAVGELLGVGNVVEGTVRRNGDRVRITVRLVNAWTDKTLWSETYERDLPDIFAVQSEIAQVVVTELNSRLAPRAKKNIETQANDIEISPGLFGTLFYGVVVGDTTRLCWSLVFLSLALLLAYPQPI